MCENTRKPNNLAKLKDKRVIHQKLKSVGINYKRMTGQVISLGTTISLGREITRHSENAKFR